MRKAINISKYPKFLLYLIVVVLINIVCITLFFRVDLTSNKVYSLSKISKGVVATLSEPLTIKVFFTSNLPAPYNNIERYLHDLLEEYSVAGSRYFNYQFFNVSGEENEESQQNQERARGYGIQPVQIQVIEKDEVKFQKALMGMVLIHGDIIETIPTITSSGGLEYQITSAIRKMNNKISALLRLKEKISVTLFLSSSLQMVGQYLNLTGLNQLPNEIENIVNRLNEKNYGKLSFSHLDPSINKDHEKAAQQYDILGLQWNAFADRQGKRIPGDKGYAGIMIEHQDKSEKLQVIEVFRLPLFGTQYQVTNLDALEKTINDAIENVININEEIGYLADHGTPSLSGPVQIPGQPRQQGSLTVFNKLLSKEYSLMQVNIKEKGIPEGLSFLMIPGPREPFSEYELYQIDQFLMKGKNLAIFLDPFNEITPQNQRGMMMGQRPVFLPVNTGLEKLLEHYGIQVKKSYILDENCFKQRASQLFGGGEQPVYFAPIIKNEMINKEVPFLQNIKGLVMLKASPVEINEQKVRDHGLKGTKLFSSSARAWEMSGRIDLNPMFIQPPQKDEEFKSMAMAYVVEGSFPSYFADKPIPEKDTDDDSQSTRKKKSTVDMSRITSEGTTIKTGKPAKIFLIGTSEILKDNVLDEEGKSPNAQFLLNALDFLNNREDNAVMRIKTQRFNPLKDSSPSTKTIVKTATIGGLPVLVIIAGIFVWFRRVSRKRLIQQIFGK